MADKKLAGNTLALYVLKMTSYLFSFVSLPYLTRVLGPEMYGRIGFGTAFSSYVYIVVDFGFILSATAEITQAQRDMNKISKTMTSVSLAKLFLALICGAALVVLCLALPQFANSPLLFVLYLLYAAANSLIPDFVYRGLEDMKMVTVGTIVVKSIFVIGVFLFVRDSSQYLLVPLLYLLGATLADAFLLVHLKKKYGIALCAVKASDVWHSLRDSAQYFVSRVASTFYTSLNTIVLGMVAPGSIELGQFTACNNAVNAGKGLSSPIADSLFPYMIRTKNYRLLIKVLLVGECVLVPLSVLVGFIAPDLCEWFFGEGFRDSGYMMRVLIALLPIALASYLLGFPALTPMGKTKQANRSVVAGAVMQVILLCILYVANCLNAMNLCIASVITESAVLFLRLIAFVSGINSDERVNSTAT